MREGTFRSDLYYRLNVVSLQLPPLRERPEDLPLLIKHFIRSKSEQTGVPEKRISPEAVDALLRYPWPGNVREIENVIERMLVLSDHDPVGARGPAGGRARRAGSRRRRSSSRCCAARRA